MIEGHASQQDDKWQCAFVIIQIQIADRYDDRLYV